MLTGFPVDTETRTAYKSLEGFMLGKKIKYHTSNTNTTQKYLLNRTATIKTLITLTGHFVTLHLNKIFTLEQNIYKVKFLMV